MHPIWREISDAAGVEAPLQALQRWRIPSYISYSRSRLPARRRGSRIGRTGCPSNQDAAGTSARRRMPGAYCNQGVTRAELNGKLLQHDERCTAPAYLWMDVRCLCN